MRTLGIIVLVVVCVIGGAFALYKINYPTYTYRFRMTVEVEVDGKIRSASSVIEVRLSKQPRFLPEVPAVSERVTGEAVFVDLGNGRNVIALLASGPNASRVNYPQHVVPALFKLSYDDSELIKYSQLKGKRELPQRWMPTLMTFTDLNDPVTGREISPEQFAQVFGPDVQLKSIWIEMTNDPVTWGIEKRLPWWDGPFPWERRTGPGMYADTRRSGLMWHKRMLKRTF